MSKQRETQKELNRITKQLNRLCNLIKEKRSDIAEIFDAILWDKPWKNNWVEHRFAYAQLPDGTLLEYDTLTTEISFLAKGESTWKTALNHDYRG